MFWHKSPHRRNYYLTDSPDGKETWRINKAADGWYWRSTVAGTAQDLTYRIGPYSSAVAAMRDCEKNNGKDPDPE